MGPLIVLYPSWVWTKTLLHWFAGFGTLAQTQAYCDMAPDPHFIFDVQLGGVRVSAG